MTDEKRGYRKKERAAAEARTRLRITESVVELHGTLGPSRTSISAIAERAGVRRSTVYRHFPDEAALFAACTAHWNEANPAPDVAAWTSIDAPDERLRAGLTELYAYYRRTERMMANLHRDEATMPLVAELFAGFRGYLAAAAETLAAGWPAGGQVRAAIGHAVAFSTWRSLAREQELDDEQAAELMCRLAVAASPAVSGPQPARAPGALPASGGRSLARSASRSGRR